MGYRRQGKASKGRLVLPEVPTCTKFGLKYGLKRPTPLMHTGLLRFDRSPGVGSY